MIKRRDTALISCPPAPVGVIEGSRADVSFVVGLVTDKFCYHQPLYRQHQRLADNGIKVSRPWLTQLTHAALPLLEPIFTAQLDSIRTSRVKAMDETPIKAGRAGPGKMKSGYFWPVYGERDEICFVYHAGRSGKFIEQTLGTDPSPEGAVLLTDGYAAYERYAEKCGLTHAQRWSHSRRKFFDAQSVEPERAAQTLDIIGKLYGVEKQIREANSSARRATRTGLRRRGRWSTSSLPGSMSSLRPRACCPARHSPAPWPMCGNAWPPSRCTCPTLLRNFPCGGD